MMKDRFSNAWSLAGVALVSLLAGACNDSSLATAPAAADEPIAVINGLTEFSPLDTATFDGSQSHDPDGGDIQSWAWAVVGRPAGSTSNLVPLGANGAQADFFVDLAGDYTIELTVTDDEGQTGSEQWTFSAIPSQSLHVQLTWDTYSQTDNDLHLIDVGSGGSYWDSFRDCYFMNCKNSGLEWGQAGVSADNPTLDIDNISDTVPENINIITPANGSYEINVHVYSNIGGGPTTATIRVYLSGTLAYEQVRSLTQADQVWRVGTIDWSNGSGSVNEINTVFQSTFFANAAKY